ncbi:heptaprenyl diphosphate synthase component 1 [Bacillaceae bacterium SIJ1]|uniref:heptaprenyl diphosphate synthase component 1 n=1 Tax=Litoribacterium kuwaitense TaxID=1398745 RepID=UPI0013EC7DD7|nr:heptaprenyl diphosphate synthase component 1 [Litoribacterium kuwaitense]NGP43703.1 heptaprenyl diphosphate synthase component 1 [Litoribacterium kuwaitense]
MCRETLNELRKRMNKRLDHPALRHAVPVPEIDEDRMLFLYAMMKEANFTEEDTRTYIVPVMLVQLAMDTHEFVRPQSKEISNNDREQQQMTVLAGDFYSGMYYRLLSYTGDINFIRAVSQGVKVINEAKVKLYEETSQTVEQVLDVIVHIETSILGSVAEFLQTPSLKMIAEDFFLLKRLIKTRQKNEHASPFAFLFEQNPGGEGRFLDRAIEKIQGRLEKALSGVHEEVRERVHDLISQPHEQQQRYIEEGLS